jgi:hypothetical protein
MAMMGEQLCELNIARVVVVDVTDDYRVSMQPPLPHDWYPVLRELCVPAYDLERWLRKGTIVEGYLYDWHTRPVADGEAYYVGVVDQCLVRPSAH